MMIVRRFGRERREKREMRKGKLVLAGLVVVAAGCAKPGPKPDPQVVAFGATQSAVVDGVAEGVDESESLDEYVVQARHNPCSCDAPAYEVFIHGRWTRVYLDGDEEHLDEVEQTLREGRQDLKLPTIELHGAVDGRRRNERGVRFAVFAVEDRGEEEE
jgi:hypothetical protein